MKKYEPKAIICPQCKNKVGTYDGRSRTNHICRCRVCEKRVVCNVGTEEIEIKSLPQRTCSSGITFC